MITFLFWFIICVALLYLLLAIYCKLRIAKYILKPGTMVLIIVLAVYGSELGTTLSRWVVIALIFSLLGDIFLMLKEKWFVHGLASFLIAHLVYIAGFWGGFDVEESVTTLTSVLTGAVLLFIAIWFLLVLSDSVKTHGGIALLIAVASYIAIISLMVWSACLAGVTILIFGSLLFYISDAVLAVNRFKHPFPSAEYIVMSTYFTAQALFAWSII
ncbi:lysoplasmalogenase [Virgibacillus oceani]|uniref:Lysoplasmalogenase n=1 Tax=Virgibacillus oceani TaxID=1479511 RepID=A0A917M808_9BACI|nr:lysoplasmalogenase [Virgibacillus oceani]GGG80917.1 hypothetical protein GCM10011398_27890 [Virgibacillus oceani]